MLTALTSQLPGAAQDVPECKLGAKKLRFFTLEPLLRRDRNHLLSLVSLIRDKAQA